jgi:hypothetical protein
MTRWERRDVETVADTSPLALRRSLVPRMGAADFGASVLSFGIGRTFEKKKSRCPFCCANRALTSSVSMRRVPPDASAAVRLRPASGTIGPAGRLESEGVGVSTDFGRGFSSFLFSSSRFLGWLHGHTTNGAAHDPDPPTIHRDVPYDA